MENKKKFFDWLAEALEIRTPEDWYKVSWKRSFFQLDFFGESWIHHLMDVLSKYYNIKLLPWKLKDFSNDWFEKFENRRMYIDWLAETMGCERQEQLYMITKDDVIKNCGAGLLEPRNAWIRVLENTYPGN